MDYLLKLLKHADKICKSADKSVSLASENWDAVAEDCVFSATDPDGGLQCAHEDRNDFFCYGSVCPLLRKKKK